MDALTSTIAWEAAAGMKVIDRRTFAIIAQQIKATNESAARGEKPLGAA